MKTNLRITNGRWPKVKLADVAERCLGKMLDAQKNKGRLMPYLRNPNVRWFDVDTSDLQSMPFEDHEHERYGLKAGDIVICEGGEARRAAIWDGRLPDLKFQKAIHRVRPGPNLHNRYFVHRLMADHQGGRLGDYLTGATIKHFYPAAAGGAAADCGGAGPGGGVAGQAPRRHRPTRLPHPIPLPRPLRRPRD